MGFAFPKEERAALVAGEPHKYQMPWTSDIRFNWIHANLAALDPTEARELVVDAWRVVAPKKVSRAYDLAHPTGHAEVSALCSHPRPGLPCGSAEGEFSAASPLGPHRPAGRPR